MTERHSLTTLTIVFCIVLSGQTGAQVLMSGSCHTFPDLMPSFEIEKFMGIWYMAERFHHSGMDELMCIEFLFEYDGGTLTERNLAINSTSGELFRAKIGLTIPDPDVPSRWSGPDPACINQDFPFWIIDTDYEQFALTWQCKDVFVDRQPYHTEIAWLLTRSGSDLPQTLRYGIYGRSIDARILDPYHFKKLNQDSCQPLYDAFQKM